MNFCHEVLDTHPSPIISIFAYLNQKYWNFFRLKKLQELFPLGMHKFFFPVLDIDEYIY